MENNIMTLGIFAHANAGKTTITEQLLYHTNVKKSTGRVDHGDTTTDNLSVERERGISVRASLVTLPLKDRIVQLIDTPGHVDFSAEVERAISVLDGAVLVVSGVEGVEPQTQVIWKILQERHVPTLIFINKMDRMGADYQKTLQELQSKLGNDIFPIVNVTKDLKTNELAYFLCYNENKIKIIFDWRKRLWLNGFAMYVGMYMIRKLVTLTTALLPVPRGKMFLQIGFVLYAV